MKSGDFFKGLGPKGRTQVIRILTGEYQKYVIDCIKTREKALLFELWLIKPWRSKPTRRKKK